MPSKAKPKKVLKRPPRLIVSKDGKKRYLKVGSKKIRVKSKLNNEQLIQVIVNNMAEKTKKRTKRKKSVKKDVEEGKKDKSLADLMLASSFRSFQPPNPQRVLPIPVPISQPIPIPTQQPIPAPSTPSLAKPTPSATTSSQPLVQGGLLEQIRNLESKVSAYEKTTESDANEKKLLEEEIKKLETILANQAIELNKEITLAVKKAEDLKKEKDSIEQIYAEKLKEKESEITKFKNEKTISDKEIETLSISLNSLQASASKLKEDIEKLGKEGEQKDDEINVKGKELEIKLSKIQELESGLANKINESKYQAQRIDELEKNKGLRAEEILEKNRLLNEAKQQSDLQNSKIVSLQTQLTEVKNLKEKVEKENFSLLTKKEEHESKLKSQGELITKMTETAGEREKKLKEFEEKSKLQSESERKAKLGEFSIKVINALDREPGVSKLSSVRSKLYQYLGRKVDPLLDKDDPNVKWDDEDSISTKLETVYSKGDQQNNIVKNLHVFLDQFYRENENEDPSKPTYDEILLKVSKFVDDLGKTGKRFSKHVRKSSKEPADTYNSNFMSSTTSSTTTSSTGNQPIAVSSQGTVSMANLMKKMPSTPLSGSKRTSATPTRKQITKRNVSSNRKLDDDDLDDILEDKDGKKANGKNKKAKGGLFDYQIEEMMQPFNKDGFAGVIASDEIHKLPTKKRMGFVMNLDKSNQPGSHWVAVYIDADRDKSIEYYDSYGKEPPKSFLKQIKSLVNKINPDSYLKFKVNKIVDQRANSDTCGWFAQKFLIDRFNGVPFKDTTGFSNVTKGEKNIKKMKEKYEEFGLI